MFVLEKTMMSKFLIALTLILSASFARASAACLADPNDAYSAGVEMPSGPHKGECIDTSSKRAVKILKHTEEGLWIANFRHQNKFWNAWIPANSVESMEFVIVDLDVRKLSFFGINIFHNHLRFHFKKNTPIQLYSQFSPRNQVTTTVNDVIISLNYMAPVDVDYNPIKGFDKDEYLSVLQVYSTQDEANARFVEQKVNVFGIKLNVTRDQAWRVFIAGVARSHKQQYAVPYDTWDSNCALEAFNILDQALGREYGVKVEPFRFSIFKFRDTNFVPALKALQQRRLIKDMKKVKLINTEFGYPRYPSRWTKF
jgi:hypothetical protein